MAVCIVDFNDRRITIFDVDAKYIIVPIAGDALILIQVIMSTKVFWAVDCHHNSLYRRSIHP